MRKRVRRRVLLFLLHMGYVQQRSRVSQKIGLYLLARYLREAGPESPRDRLRAVLLDLHARQTHHAERGTRPADRDRAMLELGHFHPVMSRVDEARAKTIDVQQSR